MRLDQDIDVVVHHDLLGPDVWHATLTHRGTARTGFGTGLSQKEAVTKALAELVERSAFHRHAQTAPVRTSNGFAAHVDPALARAAAVHELIERDILLTGWLGRLPPRWDATTAFPAHGLELVTGIAGVCGGLACGIGLLRPTPASPLSFGMVVATSVDQDPDAARRHVLLDLRRAATLVLQRHADETPLFRPLAAAEVASGMDHLEFYLDPANCTDLGWFLDGSATAPELPPLAAQATEIPPGEIAVESLVTFRASSPSAQDFFFGETRPELVNFARLRAAAGTGEPNPRLHPLA